MAKKFYETDEAKAQIKLWNERLENDSATADGFIFSETDETVIQPQIISTEVSKYNVGDSLHELCQNILRDFKFRKDIHKTIFELHAKGMSERDIVVQLKNTLGFSLSQKGINLLIKRVKESYLKGVK